MERLSKLVAFGLVVTANLVAQQGPEIANILERLDRLEQQNRALLDEVRDLKAQLAARGDIAPTPTQPLAVTEPQAPSTAAPPVPTIEERLGIQEARVEEQAQTKVEAAQKFPITLTGMALFNAYLDSRYNGGAQYPTAAALAAGPENAGGTLRQSVIGLEFHGPKAIWGGSVHGSVYMDFFTGGVSFNSTLRLRTGSIQIDWKNRSFMVGIEKPIFNPLEPASLAQVGRSALTGAGNLWLWLPQARFEQDVRFARNTGLRARVGVVATSETQPYESSTPVNVTPVRPALEGRFEFFHKLEDDREIAIAPGFHASQTHAGGFTIPSNVYSLDLRAGLAKSVELTGAMFTGRNVALLGTGAINEGYIVYRHRAHAIGSQGGWTQLTLHATPRLDFHLFSGLQYYESSDLESGDVTRNLAYGLNMFYRIAPNVILGPEISQYRTVYIGYGTRLSNHYDFALAYLF